MDYIFTFADGGLSKLKAFRETSYTLPPGNEHDFNAYANNPKLQDHFRKMGYEAIKDANDQNFGLTANVSTHPLIVLDNSKLTTDYSGTYRLKKPPSWD